MATKVLMTAEQLETLPDGGKRYELIEGEPRIKPMPNGEHGLISNRLGGYIGRYAQREGLGVGLGPANFRIRRNPDTVRIPDAAYVRQEVWAAMDHRAAALDGAPDLAVEVVSPSDVYGEVHSKALEWLAAGTQLVIVAQLLNRALTLYIPGREPTVLGSEDTLDGGTILPGFRLPVQEIFD